MPPLTIGQKISEKPTKNIASQATSWAISSVAACADRIRSRRRKSGMKLVISMKAPRTTRSIWRVSQFATGRGTISVPMTLAADVAMSSTPTAAATSRAACGTTMGSPLPRSAGADRAAAD